jgi:hypothetical protein
VRQEEAGQGAAEGQTRLPGRRQDPLIAGGVTGGEEAECASQVGHGPATGGQNRCCL